MRTSVALLILGFVVITWSACDCGQKTGAPCGVDAGCPTGQACINGYCNVGDGGCIGLQCSQVTCPNGATTNLTGTVYDPSGQLPLYNALVYVPNGPVQAFTPGVSCDRCDAFTTGSPLVVSLSGADGTFTLVNVPAGPNIPLVIQLGRWRRQVTIPSVPACNSTAITDVNLTRLPRNQSEGDIPLIAISTGHADPLECLLRKIGISDSEFTPPTGTGRIHYYVQNGQEMSPSAPAGSTLWSDLTNLKKYDIVLLPCESSECPKPTNALQNIIDYTSAGGRVFTTHYGYVWIAFAPQPFPSTGNWQPDTNQDHNPPDPFTVSVDQTFAKGSAFADWLVHVGAAQSVGLLDVHQSRNDILSTTAVSQRWLYGTNNNPKAQGPAVEHLTFNTPINPSAQADGGPGLRCGRVVYSDFHVVLSDPNAPFGCGKFNDGTFPNSCDTAARTGQEKALEFMLFDVSSCIQEEKPACATLGQSCGPSNPCCSGVTCMGNEFKTCQPNAPSCAGPGQGCGASLPCCSGLTCTGNELKTCR